MKACAQALASACAATLAAGAVTAPAAAAATSSTAQMPGVPCSVTAQFPAPGQTMTYSGRTSCAGGVGAKTIDVVPQVFNRIHGKALWFNISLAGVYQGPTPANPLRLAASRSAVGGHSYRALVVARVVLPNGRVGSATACAGSDCSRFPVLSLRPSFTDQVRPPSSAQIPHTPCMLGQNGLVFNLVNGSYMLDYGAYMLCTRAVTGPPATLTVCAQVANSASGTNTWFTISGSCISGTAAPPTPITPRTARTAYQGHTYRIKVVSKMSDRTATLYGGRGAP